MIPTLTFSLPLPPSFNSQYFTHRGHYTLTPWSRRYRDTVAYRLLEMHWDDQLSDVFLVAAKRGHLSLLLSFFFETPLRRDLDSGLKIVQDAVISSGLGVDDSRVVDIRLMKRIDPLRPRVEVSIDVIEQWDWDGSDTEPVVPITFRLPIPPSVNDQYAIVHGRRHRSAELRRFRKHVQATVEEQRLAEQLPTSLRAKRDPSYLALYADFFFAVRNRRDIDSGLKALLDALCAPLDLNDNRVVDIHLTKRTTRGEPYTLVQLEPIADWLFDAQYTLLPSAQDDSTART